jgi:hypothetical protein
MLAAILASDGARAERIMHDHIERVIGSVTTRAGDGTGAALGSVKPRRRRAPVAATPG